MKDWKPIVRKILYPPVWLTVLLVVVSALALIVIFLNELQESPAACVIYMVAFYTLVAVCAICWKVLPSWYHKIKKTIYDNKYGNRYMTDVVFKIHVSLYKSLAVNLLYAIANLLSFFIYKSAWFMILAAYYAILAILRFLLLRYVHKNDLGAERGAERIAELKRSRLCAMILMLVNVALTCALLMMVYQNRGYEYQGILIYVMAMYTFYITAYSVVSIVKYRKYHSPVMSTAKVINLSVALVSMLSLETAMLSQFGQENTPEFRQLMISTTGAGVCVILLGLSIFMIVYATKEMKKVQINNLET